MHDAYIEKRRRNLRRKSVRSLNEQWLLRHIADRVNISDSDLRGKDSIIEVFVRDESVRAVLERLRRKGQIRRTWSRGQWHYATCPSSRLDPLTPIEDGVDLALRGIPLTQAEINKMERRSAVQPSNLILRTALMDDYEMVFKLDRKGARRYRNHILYLVEHRPGHRMLGFRAMRCLSQNPHPQSSVCVERLWRAQVEAHPDDLAVLANAVDFFVYSDDLDATPFLEAALKIEERPKWLKHLGRKRANAAVDGAMDAADAASELAAYERAWELTDEDDRNQSDAADIAEMALAAGQSSKAREFAQWVFQHPDEPLSEERDDQSALHTANIVLGHLALQADDRDAANTYLLAAVDDSHSRELSYFMIDLSLAKELLELGERDIVLRFLGRCSRLQQSSRSQIQVWMQTIERGEMPDFGRSAKM